MGSAIYRRVLPAAVVVGWITSAAWGQLGLPGWIHPDIGRQKVQANYLYEQDLKVNVFDQDSSFDSYRQRLALSFPVLQGPTHDLTIRTRVGVWDLDTDAVLPASGRDLPSTLWRLTLGAAYRQKLPYDWICGVDFSIGSPSDQPFSSGDEYRFALTGTLRIPTGETDAWLLMLNFVNARDWLPQIPLPGAGYIFDRGAGFQAMLGAPLTVIRYAVTDRLRIDARYLMLRNVHAQATYDLFKNVGVYTRFNWNTDSYMLSDRRDDDDRLFYYDKRIAGGVRWRLCKGGVLDIGGGWAFDRFFFEGEEYDDRDISRIDLADGPFVNAAIRVRF